MSAPTWAPVDAELLFVQLLGIAMPAATVVAAPDADLVDLLPLVVVSAYNGHRISNAHPSLAQEWVLSTTVLCEGKEAAADMAMDLYYQMHTLHDTEASLPDVGEVVSVDDEEMPHRVATSVLANNLTQYSGSFSVIVKPPTALT